MLFLTADKLYNKFRHSFRCKKGKKYVVLTVFVACQSVIFSQIQFRQKIGGQTIEIRKTEKDSFRTCIKQMSF